MDLVWFARILNSLLKEVNKESYHKWNYNKEVIYPFLTYEFEHQSVDEVRDEFEISISMFDKGTSNLKLLELENKLVNQLNRKKLFLDKCNIYIRTGRAFDIPTGNSNVQRRQMYISMKIDWFKEDLDEN